MVEQIYLNCTSVYQCIGFLPREVPWHCEAWLKTKPLTGLAMLASARRASQSALRALKAPAASPWANAFGPCLQQRYLHQSSPRFAMAVNPGMPVMWTTVYDKPGYDDVGWQQSAKEHVMMDGVPFIFVIGAVYNMLNLKHITSQGQRGMSPCRPKMSHRFGPGFGAGV